MKFFLDGIEANPQDFLDVNYSVDLRDRKRIELNPTTTVLTFFGEDRKRILEWVDTYSEAQGMPVLIDFEDAANTTLNYYLDFNTSSFEVTDVAVNCELVRRGSMESFVRRSEGRSLSVVDYQPNDFIFADYQVITEQQGLQYITLAITFISLQQEVGKAVQSIAEGISDVQEASIPSISAVGIPVINIPLIASAIVKTAARIVYAVFIFIVLINTIRDILLLIFPPIRQIKALHLRTLVRRAIEELNYTLQSNLLDSVAPLAVLPVPQREDNPSIFQEVFMPGSLAYSEGYPTSLDTIQTIDDLITSIETMFNAEVQVSNGVVRIERKSFFEQNAQGEVIESFNIMPDEDTLTVNNPEQFYKRKLVKYQTDPNDSNTFDQFDNAVDEENVKLINSPYPDIVTIRGVDRTDLPFARAYPKGELNVVEKFARVVAKIVDTLTGSNLVQLIEDRKNIIRLSNQYYSVTKIAWMNGNRLAPNQDQFISARRIMDEYYSDLRPEINKLSIVQGMPVAIKLAKVLSIIANNYVILNGKVVRINYVEFNHYDRSGVIDYEEKSNRNNVKSVKI